MKRSRRIRSVAAIAPAFALASTACGRSVSKDDATPSASGAEVGTLATTTPAGAQPVDKITWAVNRETNSLDPTTPSTTRRTR